MTLSEPESLQAPLIVRGRVKWFDATRGFGFVVADDGGPDILLPDTVLLEYGVRSVLDGSPIVIEFEVTGRGRRATAVLSLEPPALPEADLALPSEIRFADPARLAALPLEPARVKWFDTGKGYGFVTVWGWPEDVFVHAGVVRRSGLRDLATGDAVAVRVLVGLRGRLAAEMSPWAAGTASSGPSEAG